MKIIILFALSLLTAVTATAQTSTQETDKPKAGSFKKPLEDAGKSKEPATSRLNLTFDDGCGNPLAESQIYSYRYGKVIVVTDDNKIIVKVLRSNNVQGDEYEKTDNGIRNKLKQPKLLTVALVGLDETINQSEIKRFLLEKVLDREVTVIGNTRQDNDKRVDALVELTSDDEIDELSEYLLENGIAKFKEFQLTNLVPMRTACELKRAEDKAKAEKTGIWAK